MENFKVIQLADGVKILGIELREGLYSGHTAPTTILEHKGKKYVSIQDYLLYRYISITRVENIGNYETDLFVSPYLKRGDFLTLSEVFDDFKVRSQNGELKISVNIPKEGDKQC